MISHRTTLALTVALTCCLRLEAASLTIASAPDLPGGNFPVETLTIDDQVGEFVEHPDGTQSWKGSTRGGSFELEWDLFFDPDPGVSGVLSVTNITGVTQMYAMETGVASSIALPAGAPMTGSSSLSVADADTAGPQSVMSAIAGEAIYTAKIANATARQLFVSNYALTAAPLDTASETRSFQDGSPHPVNVGDTLSIRHAFHLSPGDSATANSTFFVVPEPQAWTLAAVALFWPACCRRRTR